MARRLKVFRTPAGFHDAYVAAPSRKAALKAWGSDRDLFARGIAEEVTDPDLMREPLACPGVVFRKSRGSADAQLAALGDDEPDAPARKSAKAKKPRKPRPDRGPLDSAEAKLEATRKRQDGERRELDARIAALDKESQRLREQHEREVATLEKAVASREGAYRRAMERWRQ